MPALNYRGILLGAVMFLVIGLFHPVVIWAEYWFSKKIWPAFLAVGLVFTGLSLVCASDLLSCVLAAVGATSLWSIRELFQQEKRVQKGWFPKRENNK